MQNDLVADSGRGRRAGRQRQILSCIQPSGSGRNLSPANQREPTDLETPCSGESKEVIGGYRFILANNLDEAAQIAKGNPCLDCGLFFEIRPIAPATRNPRQYPPVITTTNVWRRFLWPVRRQVWVYRRDNEHGRLRGRALLEMEQPQPSANGSDRSHPQAIQVTVLVGFDLNFYCCFQGIAPSRRSWRIHVSQLDRALIVRKMPFLSRIQTVGRALIPKERATGLCQPMPSKCVGQSAPSF